MENNIEGRVDPPLFFFYTLSLHSLHAYDHMWPDLISSRTVHGCPKSVKNPT